MEPEHMDRVLRSENMARGRALIWLSDIFDDLGYLILTPAHYSSDSAVRVGRTGGQTGL